MADIRPFRGIRYNPARIRDFNQVVTQPYDKITSQMKRGYLAGSPHSFVRLILPDGDDPYAASSAAVEQWLAEAVLVRDADPALYVYHQEFETFGTRRVRKGFIGVARVDEFERGTVLPHERTLSKPKADRLKLTRATAKDFEQIFMLYSDPDRKVDGLLETDGEPATAVTDEYGVTHRIWMLTDPATISRVRKLMADKVLLIADGHHRYETALAYRQEMNKRHPALPDDAALRYKTCTFVNVADPGLVIFPTHRLVCNLAHPDWDARLAEISELFDVAPIPDPEADSRLRAAADHHAFVLHSGRDQTWLLQLKDLSCVDSYVDANRSPDYKELDVTILHSIIIEHLLGINRAAIEDHVRYEREWQRAFARVDDGEFQAVLLMNPTRVEQVERLARQGERMPQKSTDFYPKLISGLVLFDVGLDQLV